jgi:23S rRNA (cytidine2498-2'-O)-methyltransferase
MQPPPFLFACCQRGAEPALKQELANQWPRFRFAFSRPGFVTFKLPEDHDLPWDFELRSIFARTYGFSLGCIRGDSPAAIAAQAAERLGQQRFQRLHAWSRDAAVPGERGFEPGETEAAREAGEQLAAALSPRHLVVPTQVNTAAQSGELVLDCVLVEPGEWWLGCHRARRVPSRWPGGVPPIAAPESIVSRAYWKMTEALLWSRLPIHAGDACVEIGSAPGGACQALLERNLSVTGIDPGEMQPAVLEHPGFTHVRARAADLKRRQFRKTRWLMVDSNVAPKHTLDSLEHIVTHRQVNVRGMLITLKLLQWNLADSIPEYLQRIRSWGYRYVSARQLAFNRQEICVAALRSRSWRRSAARPSETD